MQDKPPKTFPVLAIASLFPKAKPTSVEQAEWFKSLGVEEGVVLYDFVGELCFYFYVQAYMQVLMHQTLINNY